MSVFIKPVNKMLLVKREPVPEKKNEFGIMIPSAGLPKVENVATVTLVAGEECSLYERYVGQNLLVNAHMLQDLDIKGAKATFISENGVIAVIAESELFDE